MTYDDTESWSWWIGTCTFQAPEGCTNCRPKAVSRDVPNVLGTMDCRTDLPNVRLRPGTTQTPQFISIHINHAVIRCQVNCLMSSISQGVSGHQSVEEYRRGRLVGFPVRPSQSQRLAGLAVPCAVCRSARSCSSVAVG